MVMKFKHLQIGQHFSVSGRRGIFEKCTTVHVAGFGWFNAVDEDGEGLFFEGEQQVITMAIL